MKYITYDGDDSRECMTDYNTMNMPESDLQYICDEWSKRDGIRYYLVEY